MTKIECLNYMPELVRNVSCYLNETSHPTGSIYAEFILTQDVEDLKGIYILTFKKRLIRDEFYFPTSRLLSDAVKC